MHSSRREFIGRAIAAGAGATVLEPFAASSAQAADPGAATGGGRPDPNFFYGTVVANDGNGGLRGVDDFGAQWALQLTSSSWLWRQGEVNASLPVVGEQLSARGQRQADGSLTVTRGWANLVKFDGDVRSVDRAGTLTVVPQTGSSAKLAFTDDTTVVDAAGKAHDGASPTEVTTNDDATVIGYKADDGSLHVTRVITAADPEAKMARAHATRELPRAHAAQISVQWQGVASYFTCNGAACGTCHTTSWQIAWPMMNGNLCGPPVGCGLPAGFPSHSCSACMYVENACQTNLGWIEVQVADCGPNTRCRTTGCYSYQDVWFDLTQAAFTAIGGSLSVGHVDLWVSAAFAC